MKKFLVTTFATLFATATFAQTVSIGVSGTALYYDASGSETVKSSGTVNDCLLYTSPSPRDATLSRMPSSA